MTSRVDSVKDGSSGIASTDNSEIGSVVPISAASLTADNSEMGLYRSPYTVDPPIRLLLYRYVCLRRIWIYPNFKTDTCTAICLNEVRDYTHVRDSYLLTRRESCVL